MPKHPEDVVPRDVRQLAERLGAPYPPDWYIASAENGRGIGAINASKEPESVTIARELA